MKTTAIAVALILAAATFGTLGQDAGGPPPPPAAGAPTAGGPGGGPGRGPGGIRLLPPRAAEQLNLTAEQQKQLADLETEVKAKIEKILTPAQQEQLKQMRPPRPQGGKGGGEPGAGGPGAAGGAKGEGQPPPPPPGE